MSLAFANGVELVLVLSAAVRGYLLEAGDDQLKNKLDIRPQACEHSTEM